VKVAGFRPSIPFGGEDAAAHRVVGDRALDQVDIRFLAAFDDAEFGWNAPAEVTTQSGNGRGPRWVGVVDGQVDQRWSWPGCSSEKLSASNDSGEEGVIEDDKRRIPE
jgi:hypothetical protein